MKGIFLLLGTNMGDRIGNLQQAVDLLQEQELTLTDYSSIYESAPWGDTNQGWFLNMVVRIETLLEPQQLLDICLQTEVKMGRKRLKKWGERLIDIDILYYDNMITTEPKLVLPHPGIAMRRFTLMPMTEMAAKETHPLLNMSQEKLLEICPDPLECIKSDFELHL